MDWSLLILLFATGFALAGLALLITVVYKVFQKPPPSGNSINAPPPAYFPPQSPTQPPSSVYPCGDRSASSALQSRECGMIPFGLTIVPASPPVFTPEPPIHRAARMVPAAPLPHSVAVPVESSETSKDDSAPNFAATPAINYAQPVDVPSRQTRVDSTLKPSPISVLKFEPESSSQLTQSSSGPTEKESEKPVLNNPHSSSSAYRKTKRSRLAGFLTDESPWRKRPDRLHPHSNSFSNEMDDSLAGCQEHRPIIL